MFIHTTTTAPGDEHELFEKILSLGELRLQCMKKLTHPLTHTIRPDRSFSQDDAQVKGNFSMDAQYYREDTAISAVVPDEQIALQGFGNII